MAISESFFGMRSGSTGSLTFQDRRGSYRDGRIQVTMDRSQGTKNDNPTDRQLKNWCKFANVNHAAQTLYSQLRGFFGSWDYRKCNEAFRKANLNIDDAYCHFAYPKPFLYSGIFDYSFGEGGSYYLNSSKYERIVSRMVFKRPFYTSVFDTDKRLALKLAFPNITRLVFEIIHGPLVDVSYSNETFRIKPTSLQVYDFNIPHILDKLPKTGSSFRLNGWGFSLSSGPDFEVRLIAANGKNVFYFTYDKSSDPQYCRAWVSIGNDNTQDEYPWRVVAGNVFHQKKDGFFEGGRLIFNDAFSTFLNSKDNVNQEKFPTLEEASRSWKPGTQGSYKYLNGGENDTGWSQYNF